jgi:ATP-dependent RNA helicase RhlE
VQVAESFREYSKNLPLRSTVVYGGVDMNAQIEQLRKGVEILVATPGRLLDHVQNKTVMFNQVSVLVLDEADRMLDMGFLPDIKRIIALLPKERQNLLFSATFPDEIRTLARTLLRNPAEVQVAARNAAADSVTHVMHPVAREKKRELLSYLVQTRGLKQVLVFCGTRIGANRLAHQLRKDRIHADAIHGDKTQAERELALADFKSGKISVLVATDVASRGLDIEGLPQVINFDVPHSPEDYVHRIGRTGRAGLTGEAISLVAPQDHDAIAAIERLIKKRIDRVLVPSFEGSGESVAALMGDQPRRGADRGQERDRGRDRERDRGRERGRQHQPGSSSTPKKASDPIFSAPYEPGNGAKAESKPEPEAQRQSGKRRPQVAVLLGGRKPA